MRNLAKISIIGITSIIVGVFVICFESFNYVEPIQEKESLISTENPLFPESYYTQNQEKIFEEPL